MEGFQYLQRAQLLFQQGRHIEAIKEAELALQYMPDSTQPFIILIHSYLETNRLKEAKQIADDLLRKAPDDGAAHYTMAVVYGRMKQRKKAMEHIETAISLDPDDPDNYYMKGALLLDQEKKEEALSAIDIALNIYAEHEGALNLRTIILHQMSNKEAAGQSADYMLNKDPENAVAHANKGWVELDKQNYDQAIVHFKMALSKDPELGYALDGMKEAIKAKLPPYGLYFRYLMWMSRLSDKQQWGFIIGIYAIYRLAAYLLESNPALAPIMLPIIIVYIFFAFTTWIGEPISNVILFTHPDGRYAVTPDQRMGVYLISAFLLAATVFGGLYFFSIPTYVMGFLAVYCVGMLVPIGGMMQSDPDSKARKIMAAVALVMFSAGPIVALLPADSSLQFGIMSAFGLGVFFYSIIANFIIKMD